MLAIMMHTSRVRFKLALRRCRHNEEAVRAQSMYSEKLANRQSKNFWKEFRSMNGSCGKRSHTLDDVEGDENIARLWKQEFQNRFNCVTRSSSVWHAMSVAQRRLMLRLAMRNYAC